MSLLIQLIRPSVPEYFSSKEIKTEIDKMTEYYNQKVDIRLQLKYRPKYSLNNQIRDLLLHSFNFKCAFCENQLSERKSIHVERFRPSINAMDLNGKIEEDHYWWLRYEWSNLFLICRDCNQKKSNLFPIRKKRALPYTRGYLLNNEEPFLIDPCLDYPEEHFLFDYNTGLMASNTERGRLTIDIYGLNRQSLLQQRVKEIKNINIQLSGILSKTKNKKDIQITNSCSQNVNIERNLITLFKDSTQPFLLIKRQYIVFLLSENQHLLEMMYFKDQWFEIINSYPRVLNESRRNVLISDYNEYLQKGEIYDLNTKSQLGFYFRKSLYIEKVEIKNFKTIRNLKIEISPNKEGNAPWYLILGENSTGKSSILKAIALTLMGPMNRRNIKGLDARKYLTHRSKTGYVKVFLSGRNEPVELFFNNKDSEFKGNIEDVPILLMGYGSTRLLSKNVGKNTIEKDINAIRSENLFNPIFSLVDAELWLSQLSNRKFKDATNTIKRLFAIDENYKFYRRNNRTTGNREIFLTLFGSKISLDDLSDGYQSIVALACDIMMVLQTIWQDVEYAQGVVLLDELDVHLHPRWKMQIVNKFRQAFPKIQFISTSHEPLVLRGLSKEEILVLKRNKNNTLFSLENLPSPEALRIDQILTSPYFGLNSTIDPSLESTFDRYYYLLSENYLSIDDEKELLEIQEKLKEMKLLGDTPREQLMYKAIDEFVSREKETINQFEVDLLKEETVNKVIDIMTSLNIKGEHNDLH